MKFHVKIMRNFCWRIDRFMMRSGREASMRPLFKWALLDVGSEKAPYRKYFKGCERYVTLDRKGSNADWCIDMDDRESSKHLPNEGFDVIICTQVLEHLKEPAHAFREFYRTLRPGGKVYLTTHGCFEEHMIPNHYFNFTRYGLRHLAESAGFTVEHLEPQGGIFQMIALTVCTAPIKCFLTPHTKIYWAYLVIFSPLIFSFCLICGLLDFMDTKKTMTPNYEVVLHKK